jgi:hypothetical protein
MKLVTRRDQQGAAAGFVAFIRNGTAIYCMFTIAFDDGANTAMSS